MNVLAMASKLGSSCGYITRVSDDPMGDYLLDSWRRLDMDVSEAKQMRGFNAFQFYSPASAAEGQKINYRAGSVASGMVPDDVDPDYVRGARLLHVSAISQGISPACRQTVLRAVKIAHGSNVIVSYDTNLRLNLWSVEEARQALDEVLPYVDIILPSHPHESQALVGLDSAPEVIDYFLCKGVQIVALKCGEAGGWVGTRKGMGSVAAVAPRGVFDTAGAGDTFVGGFVHCITEGMDPFEAIRWAVASAGLKVGGHGIVGQPTREEVEACLGSVKVVGAAPGPGPRARYPFSPAICSRCQA